MRHNAGKTTLLAACFLILSAPFVHAEDCDADPAWFGAEVPPPNFTEPAQGDDCQFYKDSWQTFLYSVELLPGSTPDATKPRFTRYANYVQLFGQDRRAGFASPVDDLLDLAPRVEKSGDPLEAEDIEQAGSRALLIDRNGHIVFYSINVDPIYEAFVEKYGLNDKARLANTSPDLEFPVGAVEFKAAWQIIDGAPPVKDFLIADAVVPALESNGKGGLKVSDTEPARKVKVALIGLHVVFRPENHPEFVWATFEHKSAAPNAKADPSGGPVEIVNPDRDYLLFPAGTTPDKANMPAKTITVTDAAMQIFSPTTPVYRVFPFSSVAPGENDTPLKEEDEAVVAINESVHAALGDSVLTNYRLVGAVWLDDPRNPNPNRAFVADRAFNNFEFGGENHLSNMTMESFTQKTATGCFSCHDTTKKGILAPKRVNVSHLLNRFINN